MTALDTRISFFSRASLSAFVLVDRFTFIWAIGNVSSTLRIYDLASRRSLNVYTLSSSPTRRVPSGIWPSCSSSSCLFKSSSFSCRYLYMYDGSLAKFLFISSYVAFSSFCILSIFIALALRFLSKTTSYKFSLIKFLLFFFFSAG